MKVLNNKPKIAIVTFTDDRDVGVSSKEVENHLRRKQDEVKNFLISNNIDIFDPLDELREKDSVWYGIRTLRDVSSIISILSKYEIDAAIIGAWTWSI